MSRKRIYVISLVCLCSLLTTAASYAETLNFHSHLLPHHNFKNRTVDTNPNSERLKAARAEALAESKGLVTPEALAADSSGFTPKYTLYVGCTKTPHSKTFPTIQGAVAAAQPYTLIKVCPGDYSNGGPETGIVVASSYVKIQGTLAKSGAETLACNTIPDQTDGSFAFELLGSHDTVQYITVNDCEYGVESGFETETRNNAIWGNWFNGDYQSIENYIGYASEITGNKISNSVYPLISYGGIDDVITGNTIEGDGTFNQDGIVAVFGVGSRIESNTVTGASAGLDFGPDPEEGGPGYNSFAFVSCNRFDDNGVGIAIVYNNSGNTFEKNYADGNEEFGIASDNTSGADAIPNSGPNKFLSNHASGNGAEDYLDATAPYTGTNSGTNDGTADYYKGNKGNTASPAAIL